MRIRRDAAVVRTREPSVLFGDYAVGWIGHQVELAGAGLIRANTIARFESALAAHLVPFFASYPLSDITRERCDAFRSALYQTDQLAPRTINALMEILRLVLRRAIQDGVTHRPDPVLGIRPLISRGPTSHARSMRATNSTGRRRHVARYQLLAMLRGESWRYGKLIAGPTMRSRSWLAWSSGCKPRPGLGRGARGLLSVSREADPESLERAGYLGMLKAARQTYGAL